MSDIEPTTPLEIEADDDDAAIDAEASADYTLDSVKREYYTPERIEAAGARLDQITGIVPEPDITKNWDETDAEGNEIAFPEGYGIGIIPISQRSEIPGQGIVNIGVAVAAIPSFETIQAHVKGAAFIRSTVQAHCMARVANAVRPKADGTSGGQLPFSVESFIETARGKSDYKTYSELAPAFVKALRKLGLDNMTSKILRLCLQSKAFAEANVEPVPQEAWVNVLNQMIAAAEAQDLDPGVLQNWLASRDAATLAPKKEIDFSALATLSLMPAAATPAA